MNPGSAMCLWAHSWSGTGTAVVHEDLLRVPKGVAESIRLFVRAQDLGNEERWPCRSLGSEPLSRAKELEWQVRLQLGCFGTGQEQGKRDEGARQVRSGSPI